MIARPVGDMALAVDAEDLAARAGDRDAIEIARAVLLEEGDGDDDAELLGELCEREHARVLVHGIGGREPFRVLLGRKVDALEQLGRQDHLRAFPRGLANQALDLGDIGRHVVAERRLDGGNGERRVPITPAPLASCNETIRRRPNPPRECREREGPRLRGRERPPARPRQRAGRSAFRKRARRRRRWR